MKIYQEGETVLMLYFENLYIIKKKVNKKKQIRKDCIINMNHYGIQFDTIFKLITHLDNVFKQHHFNAFKLFHHCIK